MFNEISNLNPKVVEPKANEKLEQAAKQFEAILLMRLTSALNLSDEGDDDENKLFGSDGGTGLAKQMFSEQLAGSIAQAGGVGLADLILQKFQANFAAVSINSGKNKFELKEPENRAFPLKIEPGINLKPLEIKQIEASENLMSENSSENVQPVKPKLSSSRRAVQAIRGEEKLPEVNYDSPFMQPLEEPQETIFNAKPKSSAKDFEVISTMEVTEEVKISNANLNETANRAKSRNNASETRKVKARYR